MNTSLTRFLQANDLDDLLSIKDNLTQLEEEDQEAIASVLWGWVDKQVLLQKLAWHRKAVD